MERLFSILVLLTVTPLLFSQNSLPIEWDSTHEIYNKSFDTNQSTVVVLDLKNTIASIEKSKDNKVHIKYNMAFKNYKKKAIEHSIEQLKIDGKKENNKITFSTKSSNHFYALEYDMDNFILESLNKPKNSKGDGLKSYKNDSIKGKRYNYKSLKDLLAEINKTTKQRLGEYLGSTKVRSSKRKWKSNSKARKSSMIIKIPSHVKIRGNFENSRLTFTDSFNSEVTVNSKKTRIDFENFTNYKNDFDVDGGYFRGEYLKGGNFKLTNVNSIQIGQISDSKINSEFSKIEIGELGSNIAVIDFNSKFRLYNFTNDFKNFDFDSEYSEVNFFGGNTNKEIYNKLKNQIENQLKKFKKKLNPEVEEISEYSIKFKLHRGLYRFNF